MRFQRVVNFLLLIVFVSADRNNVCKKWLGYAFRDINKNCYYDIDAISDVPSIITRHGYKFEGLKAKTEDDYYLSVFRIPSKGIPVLLVHSFPFSSSSFVSQIDKKNALAFLLADKGYDVYLLNYRGTRYSQEHEIYTTKDHKFWDTGIDEIARYDLEATFKLIERVSGHKKLLYIGYQVGATALFAYGSIHPDKVKEKVAGAALISPFVEMRNSGTILSRIIGRHPDFIWNFKETVGLDKFLSNYKYQSAVSKFISKSGLLMFLFVGFVRIKFGFRKELTAQSTPYYLNADFQGGPFKIYLSINQYKARPFSAFDYGKSENVKRYGQNDPPLYNYTAIQIPLYIVHPADERILKKKDVDLLYSNLATEAKVLGRLEISGKYITDYSLIFGENAKTLVYEPIFDKFETLKLEIKKESVKKWKQQSGNGSQQGYDLHKLINHDIKENKRKEQKDEGHAEEELTIATEKLKEAKEAKQIAETVKTERAGNLTYEEIQQAKQKAKAQGARNNTYYVKEA